VAQLDAFFLQLGQGSRFCVLHKPLDVARTRGAILFVHPFAEEMNKSRRMVAVQSRAFAAAGWTVLQVDLLGCGDSAGDFSDATWQLWTQDVVAATQWLRTTTGHEPVLWGLRSGCLLITEAAQSLDGSLALILWQPVLSGKQFLQQFLRLKVANQITAEDPSERSGTQQLRTQLIEGIAIEVAGYTLAPALALPMEAAGLELQERPTRVAWLEVGASTDEELSPAARLRIEAWQQAGHSVEARVVNGPRFWQTLEISECPALVDTTIRLIDGWSA